MPQENQNDNFSVTKCRIYLNPCCKFELFSRDLSKKIYQFGPRRNSGGPLFTKGAKNEPQRAHLGVHLGVHEGQEEEF